MLVHWVKLFSFISNTSHIEIYTNEWNGFKKKNTFVHNYVLQKKNGRKKHTLEHLLGLKFEIIFVLATRLCFLQENKFYLEIFRLANLYKQVLNVS